MLELLVYLTYFLNVIMLVQVYHEEGRITVKDIVLLVVAPLNMTVVISMWVISRFVNLDDTVFRSRRK